MGRRGKGFYTVPVGRQLNSTSIAQGIVLACPIVENGGLFTKDFAQTSNGTPQATYVMSNRGYTKTASSRINFAAGVTKSNVIPSNTSPFTVSFWMKNNGAATSGSIWGWGNSGAGVYLQLNAVAAGIFNFDYYDGTRYIRCRSTTALTSGTSADWIHVVCTRDNTNAIYPAQTQRIFINGIENGAVDNAGNGAPNNVSTSGTSTLPFSIGARGSATAATFTGLINNFIIWNRQLSATEIMQLYARPYCMYR